MVDQGPQTESAKVGWMMVAVLIACIAMALLALCHTGWLPFDSIIICRARALHIYVTALSWAFAGGAFYLGLHKLGDVRLSLRLYLGMFLIAVFLCAYDTRTPSLWMIFDPNAAINFATPAVGAFILGTFIRWMIRLIRSIPRE